MEDEALGPAVRALYRAPRAIVQRHRREYEFDGERRKKQGESSKEGLWGITARGEVLTLRNVATRSVACEKRSQSDGECRS